MLVFLVQSADTTKEAVRVLWQAMAQSLKWVHLAHDLGRLNAEGQKGEHRRAASASAEGRATARTANNQSPDQGAIALKAPAGLNRSTHQPR